MSEKKYPFPTANDDVLRERFGMDMPDYSQDQLEAAAIAWNQYLKHEPDVALFVQLLCVCEGSASEATILWDALKTHREVGLYEFLDRPSSYYGRKFKARFLGDRRCRRGFEELRELGFILEWPNQGKSSHKIRLDWVRLWIELSELAGHFLTEIAGQVGEQA